MSIRATEEVVAIVRAWVVPAAPRFNFSRIHGKLTSADVAEVEAAPGQIGVTVRFSQVC